DVQTDVQDVDEDNLLSTSVPKDVPGKVELAHYSDEEDDNIPLSIFRDMLHRTEQHDPKKRKKHTPIWSDDMEDVEEMEGTYTRESVDELANTLNNSTPVQIFEKFGYHKLPKERFYWSLDEDFNPAIVYNAISKYRFYEIKKFLHFSDNTALDKNDKMAKLRPLMNLLNRNFQQWGIFWEKLSIDEAMVKYFGHHSSKKFLIKKPVRFGYKNWMLCSSS
ncbi:hypothetical protein CBL_21303, partial [Carabus blaptoides fortunei]